MEEYYLDDWYCETCSFEFSKDQIEWSEDLQNDCCPKCGDSDIHELEE
jgi:predicted Zn-ribbon and HTH transcriptional regulator